ncbi:hypothetical protein Ddc_10353 [Ditylenchus destructor]|nr:hypothetical protein Ddc_10353 [Ditylenchus destructor]
MRVSLAEYYRGTKKELERKLSEKRREHFNRRHSFYRAENEIEAQSTAYDGNENIDDSRNESTCAEIQQDDSMNSSTLDDSRTTSDDSPSQKLIKIGERITKLNDITKKRRQNKQRWAQPNLDLAQVRELGGSPKCKVAWHDLISNFALGTHTQLAHLREVISMNFLRS